jgi:hypothetical protein
MKRKIIVNVLLFSILIGGNYIFISNYMARAQRIADMNLVLAEIESFANLPTDEGIASAKARGDRRVATLKNFFRKYNSDLYAHAELLVKEADKRQYDYRLLAGIAMKESTLCKFIPPGSHNCWGWGIYGNTVTRFKDYPEAIRTVSRGIKKYYIDQGLDTPEKIMAKYTGHPENTSWAGVVNHVMGLLE